MFLPRTDRNTELPNPRMGKMVQGAGEGGKIRSFILDLLQFFFTLKIILIEISHSNRKVLIEFSQSDCMHSLHLAQGIKHYNRHRSRDFK